MTNVKLFDLPLHKRRYFVQVLREVSAGSRFEQCKQYMQHGNTSVWHHCIQVAYTAYCISHRFNIDVNERDLIRGALLHDYFLYDWHENNLKNKIHGFTHPYSALREASKDFNLTKIEKDMIKKHMFPLTPIPPRYTESIILCMADKYCATRETLSRDRIDAGVKSTLAFAKDGINYIVDVVVG